MTAEVGRAKEIAILFCLEKRDWMQIFMITENMNKTEAAIYIFPALFSQGEEKNKCISLK